MLAPVLFIVRPVGSVVLATTESGVPPVHVCCSETSTLTVISVVGYLASEGPHEVWIWSPAGDTGDWQFGLGVEEDFTGGAFADIFSHWGQYAY
jgi:hypothetical protein